MSELNPTRASLLGFLHDGPMTGWDLLETVQRTIGYFWNVTPSHVYRELHALDAAGLIKSGVPGHRSKRPFALTEAGREAFAAWIAKEPGQELIRFPLLISMFFGHHLDGSQLAGFLQSHRRLHEQRLAEYRKIEEAVEQTDQFILAATRFGIGYEEAALRWFDAQSALDGKAPPDSGAPNRRAILDLIRAATLQPDNET